MKTVAWKRRERRIRLAIIKDLIVLDLLTHKPVSQQRVTGQLTAIQDETTWPVAVAEAPTDHRTRTMPTEHAP